MRRIDVCVRSLPVKMRMPLMKCHLRPFAPYIGKLLFVDNETFTLKSHYCYMEAIEESGADIVCGGYQRVSETGKVLKTVRLTQDGWAKFVVVAPWAHLYRTAFLRNHGIGFLKTGIGEDMSYASSIVRSITVTGTEEITDRNAGKYSQPCKALWALNVVAIPVYG